jgi:LysM repeat protein
VPNVVAAKQDTLVKPLPTKPLIAWQDTAKPIATPTHADTGAHLHNGLKAFHGHKGDVLLPLAIKYNVRYARLLEYNDIPDAPLASDMLIYLEKKHKKGAHDTHVVKEGETLLLISQLEGMMLSQLKEYNLITYDGLPATGSILHLQDYATRRPKMLPITKPPTFKPITTPTGTKPKPEYISKAAIDSQNKAKDAPTVILTTETTVTVEMKKAEDTTKQKSDLDDLKSKLDKLVYAVDDTPTHASNNKDTTAYHPTRDSILSKYSGDFGERQAVKNKPTKEIKPTAKAGAKYYTVKKGDTGFSIAKKHKLTLKQLKQLNNIDFDDIKIGQRLRVK